MNKEIAEFVASAFTVLSVRHKEGTEKKNTAVAFGRAVPWNSRLHSQFVSVLSQTGSTASPILMLTWSTHTDLFLVEAVYVDGAHSEKPIAELGSALAQLSMHRCPEGDTGTPEVELYVRTEAEMNREQWDLLPIPRNARNKDEWEHAATPLLSMTIGATLLNIIHICAKPKN